jgi:hypothetical protein
MAHRPVACQRGGAYLNDGRSLCSPARSGFQAQNIKNPRFRQDVLRRSEQR